MKIYFNNEQEAREFFERTMPNAGFKNLFIHNVKQAGFIKKSKFEEAEETYQSLQGVVIENNREGYKAWSDSLLGLVKKYHSAYLELKESQEVNSD